MKFIILQLSLKWATVSRPLPRPSMWTHVQFGISVRAFSLSDWLLRQKYFMLRHQRCMETISILWAHSMRGRSFDLCHHMRSQKLLPITSVATFRVFLGSKWPQQSHLIMNLHWGASSLSRKKWLNTQFCSTRDFNCFYPRQLEKMYWK